MFSSAVLVAFIAVIQSLRMVEFVVNRGLPSTIVLELLALRTPSFMAVVLPISFFTALLFTYTKMQGDSELVIMRAVGMSEMKVGRPAIFAALIVMAAAYGINLYVLPVSFSQYKSREYEYRNAYGTVMLQAGRFNTPTDTLTVYVRERVGTAELHGILIRDARDPDHPLTILAERGILAQDGDSPRVVLFDGNRQEIDPDTGRLTLLYFNQYSVGFDAKIPALQTRFRDDKERFIGDLLYPGDTPSEIQHHDLLVSEGHRRLSEPLNLLALAFISLTFLLTGQHGRRGMSLRVLGAVFSAVALQALAVGAMSIVSKNLAMAPILYAIPFTVVMLSIALIMHGLRPKASRSAMPAALTLEGQAG